MLLEEPFRMVESQSGDIKKCIFLYLSVAQRRYLSEFIHFKLNI